MAQCSLAGKSLLPSLLFYRTQGAKPCQVVAEIFSRPPQGKTSLLLLHFPLLIFHVSSYYRECENERTTQNPQPKPLPWRAIFPTFQPHLEQICLGLLDLHPSVIHSTSQSIFLNALCHYSVPGLCSCEMHTMAVTLMESSPVPLEKPSCMREKHRNCRAKGETQSKPHCQRKPLPVNKAVLQQKHLILFCFSFIAIKYWLSSGKEWIWQFHVDSYISRYWLFSSLS